MPSLSFHNCFAEHFETSLTFDVELGKERDYALSMACKAQPVVNSDVAILSIVLEIEARLSADSERPIAAVRGKFHAIFVRENMKDEDIDERLRLDAFPIAIDAIRNMIVRSTSILNLPELFDFPDVDMKMVKWMDPIESHN